jgi:hypothetical protein
MKAEHRKELQTNILADRMGRFVQRMKERPKKRVLLYVMLIVAVAVGLFIFTRFRSTAALEESERWMWLEDGFQPYMDALREKYPETNAGKAARFQYAWMGVWDDGLKELAVDPVRALGNLDVAERMFLKLKKECDGDSIWEPEALYGLAVIEESRAIRLKERAEHLAEALKQYKNLAEKHKNSARGKVAAQRAEAIEKRGKEIADFYEEQNSRLDIEKRFADSDLKEKIRKKLK